MKYIKAIILTLLILVSVAPINVLALEQKGFQTSEIDETEIELYIKNFEVELLTVEPERKSISCFDISVNENIALGNQVSDNCCVSVYDSNLKFLYGFSFKCAGSYYVEWNNECLNIYYVRDDISVTYNNYGEIVNIGKIDDTMQNNSYWYALKNTERKTGDVEYKIQNDMGILNLFLGQSSYSQLVKTDKFGTENVLYDVNDNQIAKCVLVILLLSAFILLAASVIVMSVKKARTKSDDGSLC